VTSLHSSSDVSVDLLVGRDGSSLGAFESMLGSNGRDSGEAEFLSSGLSLSPGLSGSGSSSSVSGGSSFLVADHGGEASPTGLEHVSPVVGLYQGGLSLLNGVSSGSSPALEGTSHSADVEVGSLDSSDGGTNGALGSAVMGTGSADGPMGALSGLGGAS